MFDDFIHDLAEAAVPPHVTNPYAGATNGSAIRRHNLCRYLEQMAGRRPTAMLVAEAPGYRGCRLTGIPFASRQLLTEGIDRLDMLGLARGYRCPPEWPEIWREASATIVWATLLQLPALPLLWNAFPWHPHQPGRQQSNRTPKSSELALGERFVRRLQSLYQISTIIGVGKKAGLALDRWQICYFPVRHPSHGGKAAFEQGVTKFLGAASEFPENASHSSQKARRIKIDKL